MTAYLATPKAEAPRPKAEDVAAARALPPPSQAPVDLPEGTRVTRIRANGEIRLKKVAYMVDGTRRGQEVLVVIDGERIIVADLDGEILIEHTKAAPGIKYVGNGRPRGRRSSPRTSPMS